MKKFYLPIAAFLALATIIGIAFASTSEKEIIENQIGISKEYQEDLFKQNEELRAEAKPLQERLDKINKRIQINKQLWSYEQGKIDTLNETFQ